MIERAVTELGTFEIWREFSELSRQYDRLLNSPFSTFFRRRKQTRLNTLNQRIPDLARELASRYQGILRQLWRSTHRAGQDAESAEMKLVKIWLAVQDRARVERDPRRLPAVLWQAAVNELGSEITACKVRFMLRPFVDAMAAGDARGVLRALAYSRLESGLPDDEEIVATLEAGCPVLHQALLDRFEEVSVWTDGVVTAPEVLAARSPYHEYLHWLFAA